jgi:hypothetical protein
MEVLEGASESGLFIHFNDGRWGPRLCTCPIMTVSFINEFCGGIPLMPAFRHYGGDNWATTIGQRSGHYVYIPELLITHVRHEGDPLYGETHAKFKQRDFALHKLLQERWSEHEKIW